MIRPVYLSLVTMPCAIFLCTALLAQPATPTAAQEATEEVEDSIVITGKRGERSPITIMLDFVNELSDPVDRSFGFARLENDLCIKTHNISAAVSDFLVQRMSALAQELGMGKQKPDCPPNLDIIFTTDARAMATHLREEKPFLLRPFGNTEGTTQGLHALEDFTKSDAVVRWWQITVPVDYGGNIAVKLPNAVSAPTIQSANSHIASGVRNKLLGTIVIIDIEKTGDASWGQLADYVAMVAMAQVDPKVNLAGYDSILNLFGSGARAAELTAWDKAYLQALYSINLHTVPASQKGQLANGLLRELQE